ncbi:hypothetical protein BDP81DRAFT_85488 [Colletotrichum phormii]|uniref:Uncharacterized protein n=1 Tax=Colletotrichum phormii TaxID=359342 RepID=A0AAJ0EMG1_9PEZI|nr:uncharacterized protein BDP81DRAFT_85488 [Colletotrichum phormii]KAK1654574.1 hypothetical protein BDP81DRAFT_85488 [Colletotrichum phormii]
MQVIPGCCWLAGCKLLATASCYSVFLQTKQTNQPKVSVQTSPLVCVCVSLSEFSAPASAFLPILLHVLEHLLALPRLPCRTALPTPSHWLALLCFAVLCCGPVISSLLRSTVPLQAEGRARASEQRSAAAEQHPAMERERTRNTTQVSPRRDPLQVCNPGPITRRAQEIQEAERRLRVSRCGKTRRAKKA